MPQTSALSRQAGVTLLELLVVLVILATVTAAVAVPLSRQSQSQASRVADVRSVIAQAHWTASKTGTATRVLTAGEAETSGDAAVFELPEGVTFSPREDASTAITLFPDGSAFGPRLRVGADVFEIDVLTGQLNAQ